MGERLQDFKLIKSEVNVFDGRVCVCVCVAAGGCARTGVALCASQARKMRMNQPKINGSFYRKTEFTRPEMRLYE